MWSYCKLNLSVDNIFVTVSEFRIRCICHALNNIHEVGVVDEKKIISRVRILVKTVKKPKAKKLFKGIYCWYICFWKTERKPALSIGSFVIYFITEITKNNYQKMPLDVKTRWNSVLPMLRGAHANRSNLSKYAIQHGTDEVKKSVPIDSEWEDVKSLADFLQPLDRMTKECSAVEQPTF